LHVIAEPAEHKTLLGTGATTRGVKVWSDAASRMGQVSRRGLNFAPSRVCALSGRGSCPSSGVRLMSDIPPPPYSARGQMQAPLS
jgi:hypothetical protein